MSLLSRREIRNQMLVLVGMAAMALMATSIAVKPLAPPSNASTHATRMPPANTALGPLGSETPLESETAVAPEGATAVNWSDVNLSRSPFSPEGEVATARSKMLHDFEAR